MPNRHQRLAATARARKQPEQAKQLRRAAALACLWELVAAGKSQMNIAQWRRVGGIAAEELLDAIETGRPHPVLEDYERRKAGFANRPPPGLHEQHFRGLVCALCSVLEQAGCPKAKARERAADALVGILVRLPGAFEAPTAGAIAGWQARGTPVDGQIIASALRHGRTCELVLAYFVPLIAAHCDQRMQVSTEPP
jgi:hypothetical protein